MFHLKRAFFPKKMLACLSNMPNKLQGSLQNRPRACQPITKKGKESATNLPLPVFGFFLQTNSQHNSFFMEHKVIYCVFDNCYIWEPYSDLWSSVPETAPHRRGTKVAQLEDGTVFIFGGQSTGEYAKNTIIDLSCMEIVEKVCKSNFFINL